ENCRKRSGHDGSPLAGDPSTPRVCDTLPLVARLSGYWPDPWLCVPISRWVCLVGKGSRPLRLHDRTATLVPGTGILRKRVLTRCWRGLPPAGGSLCDTRAAQKWRRAPVIRRIAGTLLLLALAASCTAPICHPLTIVVAGKEVRERLPAAAHTVWAA